MKYNYFKFLFFLGIILFAHKGFSQNGLTESEYGSKIQMYLDQEKENYNLLSSDIADLSISKEFYSKKTKITHVYVNQRYQGINIFNAISSVAIKDNSVFYYANNFISDIASRVNTVTPQINAETAVERVVSALNLGALEGLETINVEGKKYLFTNGNVSKTEIPVELVYFPNADGELVLAWDLSIHTTDAKNWWSIRVNALNGEIINQTDWILTCNFGYSNHINHGHTKQNVTKDFNLFKNNSLLVDGSQYNVFAIPDESPNNGSRTLVSEPADDVASPFGWHDTDGNNGAEFTITRGNNVWAMEDRNGNDGAGYAPDGTGTLNFDFPLNLNQAPALYEDVSITNLFYLNNIMHDVWYQYGFDEASGNFQETNYTGQGLGSDFVFADAQDGAGLNNATFGTPSDGSNPGMTMFLWSAPGIPGDPLTINTGSLVGDYPGLPGQFGGVLTSTPITANLVLVVDNDRGGMASTDPNDACNTITNSTEIAGNIAVIRRGVCEFGFKVLAAENAGAIAAIVVNNEANPEFISMGGGAVGDNVTIPSISVSQADGEAIISALENGETINASLQDAGPYQRDGSLDNTIIAHEYGHGISNRLTGGAAAANCLTNATQMGEGWSDWFALMISMTSDEDFEAGRGIATYSAGQGLDGVGIRTAKYSIDFAVNPFTYGDTNNGAAFSQPHGIGSIWATMLYDLAYAYVQKYGFDPDYYNGTGGNNKVMQVVMDALKLQQCNPGFVNGRDAILAADTALTGGEDQCMIWEVFANRGLGFNASQGTSGSRSDQVESFTLPPDTDPSLANCTSLSVDEFNENDYLIYPNPTNNNVFIKTNKNFGKVVLTLTDINGRQVYSKQVDLFGEVEINMNLFQSGIYVLNIKGEFINSNSKIIKN
ncbi:T9SS-dependent M36 family metallopeptidase [Hanstruepera ponticola]|uniref:T9SS-dependent M36 family metallopeptidase n=1 Tax=Hanstruepera ponticola TaxID=2042995 RepID=UPI000CF08BC7|nr:T9SS-dependent M36 family metallopeptidase [Hanstruepera ponticola]